MPVKDIVVPNALKATSPTIRKFWLTNAANAVVSVPGPEVPVAEMPPLSVTEIPCVPYHATTVTVDVDKR